MKAKSFGKNLFFVAFSRLISLTSSIAVGLLLPKIFSVTDYGYFKVFTLYAVYTALLHFGFVDGILLKFAGKNYDELDYEKVRGYTQFFIVFESIISAVMLAIGIVFISGEYRFILIMLSINMMFVNITTYYQFISQAVQRFKEYSAKSLIASFAKLILVCIMLVVYMLDLADISYRVYLVALNVMDFGMLVWYIAIYRKITFGNKLPIMSLKKDIIDIFKTGIILTVAYQVSHFVFALDRQFVNILFSTETFAEYSFAYNIVSMISTMVSSVSVVLLPILKQASKEKIIEYYKKSSKAVSIITSGALLSYFPLMLFIKWFLPNYTNSLKYIVIVLPTILFTSVITVVMFTVEKVLDASLTFFKNSCIILVLVVITNTVGYIIFKSPKAISYASLLVMTIWFLLEGISLGKRTKLMLCREFIYVVAMSVSFIAVTVMLNNPFIGALIYGIVFCVITMIFFGEFIVGVLKKTKI